MTNPIVTEAGLAAYEKALGDLHCSKADMINRIYLAMEAAGPRVGEVREALQDLCDVAEQRRVKDFDPESRVTVLETRTKDIVAFHEALDHARAILDSLGDAP